MNQLQNKQLKLKDKRYQKKLIYSFTNQYTSKKIQIQKKYIYTHKNLQIKNMSSRISIYSFINPDEYDSFQQYTADFIDNSEQMSGLVSQKNIYEPEYFLNSEYLSKENCNFNQQNSFQAYQPQLLNPIYEYQLQNNLNVDTCQYQQKIEETSSYFHGFNNNQSINQQFESQSFLKIGETFNQSDQNKFLFNNEKEQQQQQLEILLQEKNHNHRDLNQKLIENKLKQQYQTTVSTQKIKPQNEEKGKKQSQQNQFKNIVNAFKGYVKKIKKSEFVDVSDYEFSNLKKQLMRYMKLNSFNYSLLKYIINHKFYKLMLLNFFQNESQIWIESSKLHDKEDVFQKIQQLTECIKYPHLLEALLGQQKNKIKKLEA
ncbi:hypothetical protein TTHERM_000430179 (macronuclear) [Tetrahymena thermophila SB210]|uniref:Uncharacterized protein n=1 Tax=Tetrahymena thermophila (strain SB210) TaxID=312017 RepID=W7X887_TETTS|nr:hypothetical protein TTHERM_000430179 [Tetrahymena thermophila SB210]EWS72618.1 hypothetical protein TTHERM_000430179 [Tetrahymena thermophila SB210]|eukprot:XP_012654901.1 hypothetical protein TTHERM_000430179 [Tetrahymena thermophila SB210]